MTNTITNVDRAEWAAGALKRFQSLSGTDLQDVLCDLLCDLMHWSDTYNFDFDAALLRAGDHYRAEVAEEAEAQDFLQSAAADLLHALKLALQALNAAPRFPIPDLSTDSYRVASVCEDAIAKAKGGAK